jgi:hypothetical protein
MCCDVGWLAAIRHAHVLSPRPCLLHDRRSVVVTALSRIVHSNAVNVSTSNPLSLYLVHMVGIETACTFAASM